LKAQTAIAAGIGLRTFLTLTPTRDASIELHLPDLGVSHRWPNLLSIFYGAPPVVESDDMALDAQLFARIDGWLRRVLSPYDIDTPRHVSVLAFLYLHAHISYSLETRDACVLEQGAKQ
jgi:hypothetical protein